MKGEKREVRLFCMRSRYSGKIFLRPYAWERQEMFFDAHMAAFAFFGQVFPVLVYDNVTVAVHTVLRGKRRREQERFDPYMAHQIKDRPLFREACLVSTPWDGTFARTRESGRRRLWYSARSPESLAW